MSTETKKKVALMPGLESEEAQINFNKKLDERNQADYRCYMALAELGRKVGFDEGGVLHKALTKYFEDSEEAAEMLETLREAVEDREKANNELMGIVAGRS